VQPTQKAIVFDELSCHEMFWSDNSKPDAAYVIYWWLLASFSSEQKVLHQQVHRQASVAQLVARAWHAKHSALNSAL
jgi:hypothetical protein